jgi:hypothetical protein
MDKLGRAGVEEGDCAESDGLPSVKHDAILPRQIFDVFGNSTHNGIMDASQNDNLLTEPMIDAAWVVLRDSGLLQFEHEGPGKVVIAEILAAALNVQPKLLQIEPLGPHK